MILAEGIQRVQSLYSAGLQSDDSRLTPRHTYSALVSGRATLLRQRSNKSQKVSQWSYQVLSCIELITAPISECLCIPANGCVTLRTRYKLPKPITGLDSHLIQAVTSIDGSIRFDEESFENVKYSKGNKYTFNKPTFYILNQYLYVTVLKQLKALTVTGLFEDFVAAHFFPGVCDECTDCTNCSDLMEIDIPIDGDLQTPLIQLAKDELIILMKQMTEDKTNDASDDTTVAGMVHQPNTNVDS